MDLKDLSIFMKVVEFGNISKAAKELNYVQSNVSARIQKLEEELHTPLFHRHNRGMVMTPEGRQLLEYAEKIVSLVTDMKKAFHHSETPTGKLEIGSVETVIKLPFILSSYNKRYEHIDLSLTTGVTDQLIDEVLNYRLDGAFVTGRGSRVHPDLIQYDVFDEELVLISDTNPATLEQLKERPFLVFNRGCGYRSKLEEWLRDEQVAPSKLMEMGTLETILGSVYSGLGVSFVPRSTVKHHEERGLIQCHEVPEQYSKIQTVFIRKKDAFLTASLEKFIDTIHDCKSKEGYNFPFL
ncbi:LysR family transcriptional regulator [Bacillus sp. FJAT-50079]|uniref:LysR family transcriptional regulator n=1 Tax=Bacillus sp. FJAT-50079 TaxID=2833577 RepID=UPI001BC9B36D|nr:LysR family transcriptional regulator [Bacillus sp. FJAT-50079]MBS4206502.1 LysR family transcriptional regulator [Bacillus sp. FJAT-50079]